MSNKGFRVLDHEQADLIQGDKTDIHREAVRSSQDSTIQEKIKDYSSCQPNQNGSGNMQSRSDGIQNKNEGTRYTHNSEANKAGQHGEKIANAGLDRSTARYGSVEKHVSERMVINGTAGAATVLGTHSIIKEDKSGIGAEFVKDSPTDKIKDSIIKPSAHAMFAGKTRGKKGATQRKSIIKSAGGVVVRKAEAEALPIGDSGELSDRAKSISMKYGYKAGKYAAHGSLSLARGSYRMMRYRNDLSKDVAAGVLSKKEAHVAALKRTRTAVVGAGSSIKKTLKSEVIKGFQEFQGSDDLGIQSITKTRDAVAKTRRAYHVISTTTKAAKKGLRGSAKAVKKAKKGLQGSAKVAKKAAATAKHIAGSAKKAFSNPAVLKGTIIAGVIVLCIVILLAVISAVMSIIPTITLKSDDNELTRTYEHVTKLDAELTDEIRGLQTSWSNGDVEVFHYYVNDQETTADGITIYTNADEILLYLDSKYDDYAFDKLIYGFFGGTNVKDEITKTHAKLYSYTTRKWQERVMDDGVLKNIVHMDINVSVTGFETYLSDHIDQMLTKDQQERMEAIRSAGIYASRTQLGSPFINQTYYISSRWGWRIHPITGALSKHTGVDIAKDAGTPISNVMYGQVATVGYDASSYGNYVIVMSGKKEVLYAHMRNVAVTKGQLLDKGKVVGYVGSTGSSTGNHLHLEYSIDNGVNTNPAFFLDGASFIGSGGTGSTDLVQVAASQMGNVGGRPYWTWFGLQSRVDWCAIFTSWCANQCGYIESGKAPRFSSCTSQGVPWFKQHGAFQPGHSSYIPKPGDYIFYDYKCDGIINHVGFVERCDGNTVYTIEGNARDAVRRDSHPLSYIEIYGYGLCS